MSLKCCNYDLNISQEDCGKIVLKMKKVDLIFSKSIHGPTGDCSFVRTMKEMKDEFAKNGIDLRVITPDLYSSDINIICRQNHVTWKHAIASFFTRHSALATRIFLKLRSEKTADKILKYYYEIEDKGDIIAFQEMFVCYQYVKSYHSRQRVLLTLHSSGDFWEMLYYSLPRLKSKLLANYKKNVAKTLIRGVDQFGFVADLPREEFCNKYHIEAQRTFYVYNGISPMTCPVRTNFDKVKLICVGTLSSRKNQMGILNAVEMMDEEYQKQIEITLVGDGDERNKLETKAKSLISSVVFTGSSNEVIKYLSSANLFCLFSKDEGFPISIVEAMRSGLPIIGSRVAGIPEQIINGKTGFVVGLDENELANVLKYVIDHKILLREMGRASYQLFIENFTIDAMVKKYSRIYSAISVAQ